MVATWQDQEAMLSDAKANAIETALRGLDGIDGMFSDRRELRVAVAAAKELLRVEEDNLRKKAERLGGVAA